MTRKPNRSVAVAGAPPPATEAVGVEVMELVVELRLGEIDGDDMVGTSDQMPTGGEFCPPGDGREWGLGPNTRVELSLHSQIVFLIKKGGTSDYGVSSRDNHHIISSARHHEMSAFPSRQN